MVQFDDSNFLSEVQKNAVVGTKVTTTKPATNVQAYEPVGKPQIARVKPTVKSAETSESSSEKSTQDQE